MPFNVLVVGCGAVGTMCAFALHQSGETTVTALLRSNYNLVRENGLHIRSIDHGEIDNWRPHNSEFPSTMSPPLLPLPA